jgi:hypothetical protein
MTEERSSGPAGGVQVEGVCEQLPEVSPDMVSWGLVWLWALLSARLIRISKKENLTRGVGGVWSCGPNASAKIEIGSRTRFFGGLVGD